MTVVKVTATATVETYLTSQTQRGGTPPKSATAIRSEAKAQKRLDSTVKKRSAARPRSTFVFPSEKK